MPPGGQNYQILQPPFPCPVRPATWLLGGLGRFSALLAPGPLPDEQVDRISNHTCSGPEPGFWEVVLGQVGTAEPLSGGRHVPTFLSAPQAGRVSYLLQEIYGIENKNSQETKVCTWGGICWESRGSLPGFLSASTEAGSWRGSPGSPGPGQGPAS